MGFFEDLIEKARKKDDDGEPYASKTKDGDEYVYRYGEASEHPEGHKRVSPSEYHKAAKDAHAEAIEEHEKEPDDEQHEKARDAHRVAYSAHEKAEASGAFPEEVEAAHKATRKATKRSKKAGTEFAVKAGC